ncbi:MAG: hypothetical protein ACJAS1_006136, partial [Oleiphilaceae bacterium]
RQSAKLPTGVIHSDPVISANAVFQKFRFSATPSPSATFHSKFSKSSVFG